MVELYNVRQQFTLGNYKLVSSVVLPPSTSPEYKPILLYKARALIALNDIQAVNALIPTDDDNVAYKAISALAKYVGSGDDASEKEKALEVLRDLSVEVEAEFDGEEEDADLVKVVSGTAFALAGEIEEALESLGAGTDSQNLEAVAVIVQIYLSINRSDLALKEFTRSKQWAEDDLLLGLIESNVTLVSGAHSYANAASFYTEQVGNPNLQSSKVLTGRGITRLLRGDTLDSKSDFEESLAQGGDDLETHLAQVVAASAAGKKGEANELWTAFAQRYPNHPTTVDLLAKESEFDSAVAEISLPPAIRAGS